MLAPVAHFWAAPAQETAGQFHRLVDEYFDDYFRHHPTAATSAGTHDLDGELEDYSHTAVQARVTSLNRFTERFALIAPASLDAQSAGDWELVTQHIQAELLALEQIRPWEKDPDRYSSGVSESVFVIIKRKFAPARERLRSVIARERQMPRMFDDARKNLNNPPRVFTEIALEQLPGIIDFFRNDVPAAFQDVQDAPLQAEFQAANRAVVDALIDYEGFLKDNLLPRSTGDFRIGLDNYRKKLLFEEMVDTPLERLLELGYADLRANQESLTRTAAKLDPDRTPREILADMEKDHPPPERLLDSFRDVLGGLRQFVTEHKIVTLPSPVPPILEETPPFMRALTFASMDTPGPFEATAKEAYFNVTLPEPAWPREKIEEHMAAFNRGTIISTAIHEAYPGHYTQFLWVQRAPSKVRKLLGCDSNAEGWAHYAEQMMLDEGYGAGDLGLRLGQLQDALLRNARFIVGIEMHTGPMTYEQGIEFFVREGYQTRANAERETKRGTSDPTYLVYTLGKLEIMKLREDYRKLRGDQFTLQEFHDKLLGQGFPPIKLLRRALLTTDLPQPGQQRSR
jgi:uncharacterized protein (DUF885 family)